MPLRNPETNASIFGTSGIRWDDLRVPLHGSTGSGLQAPAWKEYMDSTGFPGSAGGSSGVFMWHYGPTREEDLCFLCQLPHGWKTGTTLHPHVHWHAKTNTAGDVRFGLEVGVASIGGSVKTVAPATTHRESAGTTKKLHFASAHNLRTGRQIVVSGVTGGSYNGNNSAHNNTFIVTAYSDTTGAYWIQYTGGGSATESKTADAGGTVTGYTYRLEETDTQAANEQGTHYLTELTDLLMDTYTGVSVVLICRLYRTANASVPGGLNEDVPISEFDFHYEMDAVGSTQETVK